MELLRDVFSRLHQLISKCISYSSLLNTICPLIAALSDCPLPDHNICISRSLCLILKSSRHTIISLTQINVWLVISKRRQSNPFQCSNNQIEMELVCNLSKWGGEFVNGRRSGLCRCLVCDTSLMWTHSEALTSLPRSLCPVRLWGGRCRGRGVHPCGDFHSPQHRRAQGHSER